MEPIIDKLAKKYNKSRFAIRMIVRTEFECVKDTMKKADSYNNVWPYIRLPGLFLFTVKKGKREFFRNKSLKILEDVYTESGEQG